MAKYLPTVSRKVASIIDSKAKNWLETGEQIVARRIKRLIRRVGGELGCDVVMRTENIDLVAVMPTGAFVVEAKTGPGPSP